MHKAYTLAVVQNAQELEKCFANKQKKQKTVQTPFILDLSSFQGKRFTYVGELLKLHTFLQQQLYLIIQKRSFLEELFEQESLFGSLNIFHHLDHVKELLHPTQPRPWFREQTFTSMAELEDIYGEGQDVVEKSAHDFEESKVYLSLSGTLTGKKAAQNFFGDLARRREVSFFLDLNHCYSWDKHYAEEFIKSKDKKRIYLIKSDTSNASLLFHLKGVIFYPNFRQPALLEQQIEKKNCRVYLEDEVLKIQGYLSLESEGLENFKEQLKEALQEKKSSKELAIDIRELFKLKKEARFIDILSRLKGKIEKACIITTLPTNDIYLDIAISQLYEEGYLIIPTPEDLESVQGTFLAPHFEIERSLPYATLKIKGNFLEDRYFTFFDKAIQSLGNSPLHSNKQLLFFDLRETPSPHFRILQHIIEQPTSGDRHLIKIILGNSYLRELVEKVFYKKIAGEVFEKVYLLRQSLEKVAKLNENESKNKERDFSSLEKKSKEFFSFFQEQEFPSNIDQGRLQKKFRQFSEYLKNTEEGWQRLEKMEANFEECFRLINSTLKRLAKTSFNPFSTSLIDKDRFTIFNDKHIQEEYFLLEDRFHILDKNLKERKEEQKSLDKFLSGLDSQRYRLADYFEQLKKELAQDKKYELVNQKITQMVTLGKSPTKKLRESLEATHKNFTTFAKMLQDGKKTLSEIFPKIIPLFMYQNREEAIEHHQCRILFITSGSSNKTAFVKRLSQKIRRRMSHVEGFRNMELLIDHINKKSLVATKLSENYDLVIHDQNTKKKMLRVFENYRSKDKQILELKRREDCMKLEPYQIELDSKQDFLVEKIILHLSKLPFEPPELRILFLGSHWENAWQELGKNIKDYPKQDEAIRQLFPILPEKNYEILGQEEEGKIRSFHFLAWKDWSSSLFYDFQERKIELFLTDPSLEIVQEKLNLLEKYCQAPPFSVEFFLPKKYSSKVSYQAQTNFLGMCVKSSTSLADFFFLRVKTCEEELFSQNYKHALRYVNEQFQQDVRFFKLGKNLLTLLNYLYLHMNKQRVSYEVDWINCAWRVFDQTSLFEIEVEVCFSGIERLKKEIEILAKKNEISIDFLAIPKEEFKLHPEEESSQASENTRLKFAICM